MVKKYLVILVILQVFALLAIMGCQNPAILVPPDMVGLVKDFQEGADVYHCSILVEEDATSNSQYGLAWIKITESTILTRNGVKVEEAACLLLVTGMRVQVWFEGPVMESYPVQGYARRIEIVD